MGVVWEWGSHYWGSLEFPRFGAKGRFFRGELAFAVSFRDCFIDFPRVALSEPFLSLEAANVEARIQVRSAR